MELIKFTDPALREAPPEFNFETEESPQEVADLLWEKCQELKGLGLSANQVGLPAKVFVMGTDDSSRKNIFNPTLVSVSADMELAKEGCLSYPGLWLNVRRPKEVTASYQTVSGEYVVENFSGLSARVFLHEYDHMIGMNFSDHVSKLKLDMALKSLEKRSKRYIKKYVERNL